MRRLLFATLFATVVGLGCVHHDHDRHARDRHANSCEAPAVGVCAGCQVSCRADDDDQPSCTPGRSVPAQGLEPGYCSQEAICRCLDR